MRLTKQTDYALRQLMYISERPERLCTIAEVAGAHRISKAHLSKITHRLGQAGWVETVRGKGGGMRLARAPGDINLGAVVRRFEPDFDLVECFAAGSRCPLTKGCRLTGLLNTSLQAFVAHLDRHTLADLLPAGSQEARSSPIRRRPIP